MEKDSVVQNKNFKDKELSNTAETLKPLVENIQNLEHKQTNKLNFKSLRNSRSL